MSRPADYDIPQGILGLTGPVSKVAPGTLPLRGDLAHICLAGKFLAAHYVVPQCRETGADGAEMRLNPREDADVVTTLDAGDTVELLDIAGAWAWVCCGPDGPSGYIPANRLSGDA